MQIALDLLLPGFFTVMLGLAFGAMSTSGGIDEYVGLLIGVAFAIFLFVAGPQGPAFTALNFGLEGTAGLAVIVFTTALFGGIAIVRRADFGLAAMAAILWLLGFGSVLNAAT